LPFPVPVPAFVSEGGGSGATAAGACAVAAPVELFVVLLVFAVLLVLVAAVVVCERLAAAARPDTLEVGRAGAREVAGRTALAQRPRSAAAKTSADGVELAWPVT